MTELELKVKAFMETTPFLMENGIVIDEVTKDGAVLRCRVRDNQKNPYGMIHGGLLFTIQDCCCGATARAEEDTSRRIRRSIISPPAAAERLPRAAKSLSAGVPAALSKPKLRMNKGGFCRVR